jgi:hypothetical protein
MNKKLLSYLIGLLSAIVMLGFILVVGTKDMEVLAYGILLSYLLLFVSFQIRDGVK